MYLVLDDFSFSEAMKADIDILFVFRTYNLISLKSKRSDQSGESQGADY